MNIEISTERLHADIQNMQGQLGTLQQAVRQVYGCLDELNTMWEGPANRAFRTQTSNDHAVCVEMLETIGDLIECMEYAKEQYDMCHDAVNDKINSIWLSEDT